MNRREFIALVGGAVVAPGFARAQQPAKVRRIGILETVSPRLNAENLDGLRRGLGELGYAENQNYVFESRWGDGEALRFPGPAGDLCGLGVLVFVTRGPPAARAAKEWTETIPIV